MNFFFQHTHPLYVIPSCIKLFYLFFCNIFIILACTDENPDLVHSSSYIDQMILVDQKIIIEDQVDDFMLDDQGDSEDLISPPIDNVLDQSIMLSHDQWIDEDEDGVPASLDCNDQNRDIGPQAFELCDQLDNDCDDKVDEAHYDLGNECSVGQGICKVTGVFICSPDLLAVQCSVQRANPPQIELCQDQLDNDCDGQTDESADCVESGKF